MGVVINEHSPVADESVKKRRLVQWHTATITDFAANIKTARDTVNHAVAGIPQSIARTIIDGFCHRYASETAKNATRSAYIYLRKITGSVRECLKSCPFDDLNVLHDDDLLMGLCDDLEKVVKDKTQDYAAFVDRDYAEKITGLAWEVAALADRFQVPVNLADDAELLEAVIVRASDRNWWYKRLAKKRDQINEQVKILLGLVRKNRQPYASNHAVSDLKNQMKKNAGFMQSMQIENIETGETIDLAIAAATNTSNPEKRRIELMVRLRGMENLADDLGYDSYFVTWTAPSKYHPKSKKYNGYTPAQTQKLLCQKWARARAKVNRQQISWFGARVAEPHADACPHWHMLIFVAPGQSRQLLNILKEYATAEDKHELFNKRGVFDYRPRFDVETIDRSKGSATGYIAKYISKNVDAHALDNQPDFETNSALNESVMRVIAWARRWSIRQFQFFGAASVTVWRECRRLKESVKHAGFEELRAAADSADWAAFTKLVNSNAVKVAYESAKSAIGAKVQKIKGVIFNEIRVKTRLAAYALKRRKAQQNPSASRVAWSPENNCTQYENGVLKAATAAGIPRQFHRALLAGSRIVSGGRQFTYKNNELQVFE